MFRCQPLPLWPYTTHQKANIILSTNATTSLHTHSVSTFLLLSPSPTTFIDFDPPSTLCGYSVPHNPAYLSLLSTSFSTYLLPQPLSAVLFIPTLSLSHPLSPPFKRRPCCSPPCTRDSLSRYRLSCPPPHLTFALLSQ